MIDILELIQNFPAAKQHPDFFKPLSPIEETQFREWYGENARFKGLNPDPDDPRHAYNYRALWRAIQADPERYEWGDHGPSTFKHADHPNRYVTVEGGNLLDSILGKIILNVNGNIR